MQDSHIFEGSFVKFADFSPYHIQELARRSNLESLFNIDDNKHKINQVMVKLFYANLNLGHQTVQNQKDCVWSLVCGKPVIFCLGRMAYILRSENDGIELSNVDCDMVIRDHISHLFLEDDMHQLKYMSLKPKARIIHRALMKTVTPRTRSYELVYEHNFKALYAIFENIKVNWLRLILDELLTSTTVE